MTLTPKTVRIADRYECQEDEIPRTLYRVQYDQSMSLRARANPVFTSRAHFKSAVEDHLVWGNREPSPFVSTFAHRQHAMNWANSQCQRAEQVSLLELDASQLDRIFSVRDLVNYRNVHTNLPESMYEDEYLVLGKIRRRSIVERIVVSPRYELEDLAQAFNGLAV
ncbi:hypothetical protein PPTG_05824 [Phytophthora nicotianae INRA-310]|uniref:DUF7587 domain-containing protein n=1 Tax=Phytophthora nicotianae (strain INRA-310) TaxID=761204 RepID=W2QUN3_PHYN3|nr:hypothetical protein PPTG_05824 [Phytophthora nicotianae INRA-310]ETN16666.1 hypothetical protein PPTG_05824 [Phytophthora nicotianae INRA-310]